MNMKVRVGSSQIIAATQRDNLTGFNIKYPNKQIRLLIKLVCNINSRDILNTSIRFYAEKNDYRRWSRTGIGIRTG